MKSRLKELAETQCLRSDARKTILAKADAADCCENVENGEPSAGRASKLASLHRQPRKQVRHQRGANCFILFRKVCRFRRDSWRRASNPPEPPPPPRHAARRGANSPYKGSYFSPLTFSRKIENPKLLRRTRSVSERQRQECASRVRDETSLATQPSSLLSVCMKEIILISS